MSDTLKACNNCKYGFIKTDGSIQCYNPHTEFFTKSSYYPCNFWDNNIEPPIETVANIKLCKNCKHFFIINNNLCECECTNYTTLPLNSCQYWEEVI